MNESAAPLVEVLLATYNGERFLAQQIDSILAQDYASVHILARDDGSTDHTRELLQEYAGRFPGRFTLLPGSLPTGSAKLNFAALLSASHASYACCADQDDVWLPDKLSRSMQALRVLEQKHGKDVPLLVFTDLAIVGDDLALRYPSFWAHQHIDPRTIHSFRRLLTQNVVTGCTALMNRVLVTLAARMAPEAFMHDWWIALVACALGHSEMLRDHTVLYRQHSANVIGAIEHGKVNLIPKFHAHSLRQLEWEQTERQASAFLRVYHAELTPRHRALLEAYSRCETSPSALTRVATQIRHRFFRTGLRHNLAILWYLWDKEAAKRERAL